MSIAWNLHGATAGCLGDLRPNGQNAGGKVEGLPVQARDLSLPQPQNIPITTPGRIERWQARKRMAASSGVRMPIFPGGFLNMVAFAAGLLGENPRAVAHAKNVRISRRKVLAVPGDKSSLVKNRSISAVVMFAVVAVSASPP